MPDSHPLAGSKLPFFRSIKGTLKSADGSDREFTKLICMRAGCGKHFFIDEPLINPQGEVKLTSPCPSCFKVSRLPETKET